MARLSVEPFNKSAAEIASATLKTIYDCWFYPRNKEGELVPPEADGPAGDGFDVSDLDLTPDMLKALHFGLGTSFGIAKEELERTWAIKEERMKAASGEAEPT